jgi:hypothetical protein
MSTSIFEESQRFAKLAGFLYLFTILAANLTEFHVRRRILAYGDAVQAARNIAASSHLFRIGIGVDLITLAAGVALTSVLFIILKNIGRNIALIAALWWLVECCAVAVVLSGNYSAFLLLGGGQSGPALDPEQLQTLARFFVSFETAGNRIAALFFGLGSVFFCYLWFRSRYIPRALAAWGIVSSFVPAVIPFLTMVVPGWEGTYLRRPRAGSPILSFEVMLGLWLLVKGIRNTEGGNVSRSSTASPIPSDTC